VQELAQAVFQWTCFPLQVPMTFMYGDRDWMDPRGGQRALAGARQHRQPTTPGDLRLFTVKKSGHYTFIDQVQSHDQTGTRRNAQESASSAVHIDRNQHTMHHEVP